MRCACILFAYARVVCAHGARTVTLVTRWRKVLTTHRSTKMGAIITTATTAAAGLLQQLTAPIHTKSATHVICGAINAAIANASAAYD